MPVIIDRDKCNGCETCLSSCPFDAIEIVDEKAVINEYCNSCMACLEVCPEGAIKEVKEVQKEPAARQPVTDYKDVWVFTEQRDGKVASVSYELLGVGKKLSNELGTKLCAVLLGADESEAGELIKWGADKVYVCVDPVLQKFSDDTYTEMLSRLISEHRPSIVLAGATPVGRSFIPRVAARLKTGLTADCTSLEIDKETNNLIQIKPDNGRKRLKKSKILIRNFE